MVRSHLEYVNSVCHVWYPFKQRNIKLKINKSYQTCNKDVIKERLIHLNLPTLKWRTGLNFIFVCKQYAQLMFDTVSS